MTIHAFLKLIAGLQGSTVLALTILVISRYVNVPKEKKLMQRYVLLVSISYLFLTVCTIISVFKEAYPIGHAWYYIAILGWFLGNISLFPMFKNIVKKNNAERLHNFINKNRKK